jgi:hypothetical protein
MERSNLWKNISFPKLEESEILVDDFEKIMIDLKNKDEWFNKEYESNILLVENLKKYIQDLKDLSKKITIEVGEGYIKVHDVFANALEKWIDLKDFMENDIKDLTIIIENLGNLEGTKCELNSREHNSLITLMTNMKNYLDTLKKCIQAVTEEQQKLGIYKNSQKANVIPSTLIDTQKEKIFSNESCKEFSMLEILSLLTGSLSYGHSALNYNKIIAHLFDRTVSGDISEKIQMILAKEIVLTQHPDLKKCIVPNFLTDVNNISYVNWFSKLNNSVLIYQKKALQPLNTLERNIIQSILEINDLSEITNQKSSIIKTINALHQQKKISDTSLRALSSGLDEIERMSKNNSSELKKFKRQLSKPYRKTTKQNHESTSSIPELNELKNKIDQSKKIIDIFYKRKGINQVVYDYMSSLVNNSQKRIQKIMKEINSNSTYDEHIQENSQFNDEFPEISIGEMVDSRRVNKLKNIIDELKNILDIFYKGEGITQDVYDNISPLVNNSQKLIQEITQKTNSTFTHNSNTMEIDNNIYKNQELMNELHISKLEEAQTSIKKEKLFSNNCNTQPQQGKEFPLLDILSMLTGHTHNYDIFTYFFDRVDLSGVKKDMYMIIARQFILARHEELKDYFVPNLLDPSVKNRNLEHMQWYSINKELISEKMFLAPLSTVERNLISGIVAIKNLNEMHEKSHEIVNKINTMYSRKAINDSSLKAFNNALKEIENMFKNNKELNTSMSYYPGQNSRESNENNNRTSFFGNH